MKTKTNHAAFLKALRAAPAVFVHVIWTPDDGHYLRAQKGDLIAELRKQRESAVENEIEYRYSVEDDGTVFVA